MKILCWILLLQQASAITWLGLSKLAESWNRTQQCTKARKLGLVKNQVNICRRNLELMAPITSATRHIMYTCQHQFSDRRWNCTSIELAPHFLPDLTGGSREQAYVYSLAAASVVQSVSRACARGVSDKCSCGSVPADGASSQFRWGGCPDDVRFGQLFSLNFVDAPSLMRSDSAKRSKRSVMNMHNAAVGRKVVAESLRTECKCHGVSGSCSIKTCWKALPKLEQISQKIKQRYQLAVEVFNKKVAGHRRLVPSNPYKSSFTDDDLIYYTQSPDYCLPDPALGSLGTRGRQCRKDDPGSAGCRSMCCGRGVSTEIVEIKQRCECKYYWCCYVKCKTCLKKVEITRCR